MYFQSNAERRSLWNRKNDKILASLDMKMRNVKPEADVQIVVCQLNTDFAFDIGTSKGTNVVSYFILLFISYHKDLCLL